MGIFMGYVSLPEGIPYKSTTRWCKVTFLSSIVGGHVNSPFQKGHKNAELQGANVGFQYTSSYQNSGFND